jgi:hypothetical protein
MVPIFPEPLFTVMYILLVRVAVFADSLEILNSPYRSNIGESSQNCLQSLAFREMDSPMGALGHNQISLYPSENRGPCSTRRW